jgi:uncharacterized protein involved in exopolysaccharide biosynthesis
MENQTQVLAIIKKIWKRKRIVLAITFLAFIFGLIIALAIPNEFTAKSTFIPQSSDSGKGMGSLGGIASLAGINLGDMGSGSDIPPSLYPMIGSSVKFKKAILEAKLKVNGIGEVSYAEYFNDIHKPGVLTQIPKYTIGLPGLILGNFREQQNSSFESNADSLIQLSSEDIEHFKRIDKQLFIFPNKKEGIVQLSFSMPDPILAAQMALSVENLLQNELIEFKIKNAKYQLNFTEQRYNEKKKEFESIQNRLSSFRDRNQNISTAQANNQLEVLEADYNFAFNIYNELAKQLEQSKLQVSKDTPVFSIIQPVSVPTEKSAPSRLIILIVITFLGFAFSIVYIFGMDYLSVIKTEWSGLN